MVDPGALILMLGKTTARALIRSCVNAGYKPLRNKLGDQLGIASDCNGAKVIKYNYEGPITEEGPPKLYNFSADIVQEPGEELPGLLEMDVLKLRRAILDSGNK